MNQLLSQVFLPLNDSKQHLRASKHLLSQVHKALEDSDKRSFSQHATLKNNSGLSLHQLEKKLNQIYGVPSKQELFTARKVLEEHLNLVTSQPNITPRKVFVVGNSV